MELGMGLNAGTRIPDQTPRVSCAARGLAGMVRAPGSLRGALEPLARE